MKTDVKRHTKTDALVAHIKSLGCDKFFKPVGIRTGDLADATGVPKNSIQALLEARVKSGELVACKITNANGREEREYRAGAGVTPPAFNPLDTRRNGIARGGVTKPLPVTTPAPSLSTPKPTVGAIRTPTLITKKTQPEVVAPFKTPAAGDAAPPPVEPAVAAQATPKPKAGAALKKEPAAPKASAGDVMRIGINDAGTLVIAIDGESMEFNPKQARRLGSFMAGTAGVWGPL